MSAGPIAEIKSKLDFFEERLHGIAAHFQIPSNIAQDVLDLDWESFSDTTGGFIDKSVWKEIQSAAANEGVNALSGLSLGPTKIAVGSSYAIWNGTTWISESELPQPEE